LGFPSGWTAPPLCKMGVRQDIGLGGRAAVAAAISAVDSMAAGRTAHVSAQPFTARLRSLWLLTRP
jgi:hypothetical protein